MLARRWTSYRLLGLRVWRRHASGGVSASTQAISPVLLSRARGLAAEHAQLSKQLLAQYDNQIAKKAGSLSRVTLTLNKWDAANNSLKELQSLLADPSSDAELRSLAEEEVDSTNNSLQTLTNALQTSLVPEHPFAQLPCLIEIRPGAGGDEASLFVGELLRMYTAYCKEHGWPCQTLKMETDSTTGAETKVTEGVLEIDRANAYEHFRCEAGVHRVQRVPLTESKGRTHTSAVSVLVLPSFPETSGQSTEGESGGMGADDEDPNSDTYVNTADVRVETMRARGAGGQHVNMTDSAVRLTHIPTNTVVSMQDGRSQLKNRTKAWQILRAKLAQARREAREEERVKLRTNIVGVGRTGRGDKIRTYNFGQQRVTDHRCGFTTGRLDDVISGGSSLNAVMEEVRVWLKSQDLEILVKEEEAAAVATSQEQKIKKSK